MKLSILVLKIISVFFIVLLALYAYYSSDYYIGKITKSEIEKELGFTFQYPTDVLEYKSYGWAEEWGEELLFKLKNKDCESIPSKLKTQVDYSIKASYHQLFSNQDIKPTSLFVKSFSDPNGNFRQYAIDIDSCVLYRLNHIE